MNQLTMPTEPGFFAARLKELRSNSKMSQAELAKQSGIGLSTICQFEYGMREPTFETLVKLAEGLGVALSDFDPRKHKMPAPDADAPQRSPRKPTAPKPAKPQPKKPKK